MATTLALAGNADFNGDLDVDGTTNLDVVDIDGAVDMASTLQVDGSITSSDGMTITTADNSNTLTLISTDEDAVAGPRLAFQRQSASPADDDVLGQIFFTGKDSGGNNTDYATIRSEIMQESDGSEDGQLEFDVLVAGTQRKLLTLDRTEVCINEDSVDINFRVESNGNANMLFVDGGNDRVGFGTATPGRDFQFLTTDQTDVSIIAANNQFAQLLFGDPDDDNPGFVSYNNSDNSMQFGTNATEKMRILSGGQISTGGDTSPDVGAGDSLYNKVLRILQP